MAKGFILRYRNAGTKMCPVIGKMLGFDVFKAGEPLPLETDFIVRWGTTAPVGLRRPEPTTINTAQAINETCDKRRFRKELADAGLAPRTWTSVDAFRNDIGNAEFDVLIRPDMHERSEGIYRAQNVWDVMDAVKKIHGDLYISEYIHKVAEFRVMVAQGRATWVIEKEPKDKGSISWGCVQDGEFDYVGWEDWNLAAVDNAIRSFNCSKLDFGAVDVIVDANGKAYTLEVNTAPYLTTYYAETLGKALKYMVEKGKDKLPVNVIANWKNFIHPAVSEKAIL